MPAVLLARLARVIVKAVGELNSGLISELMEEEVDHVNLVNRLLHGPAVKLREMAADDPAAREEAERLVAALFALDRTPNTPKK